MTRIWLVAALLMACGGTHHAVDAASDGAIVDPSDGAPDAATTPCSGLPGDFHDQPFESGGETRHYFLHVPPAYACKDTWPLLVDFHGTGSGDPTDPVEESWAFDEMNAAADAEGFIVVRPRSRYASIDGQNIFQWDINAGDPARNRTFATALIADLESRYHVDPQRVYASGFSNGPSQALQFLQNDPPLVHGYMIVSGGLNEEISSSKKLTEADGRVYVMVGFRDYMWSTTRMMYDFLSSHGFDASRLWRRQANTGHELYGWHYREAFAWMDRGDKPAAGTLATGWTAETTPAAMSITALESKAGIVTATGEGGILRRDPAGAWTAPLVLDGTDALPPHLESVCFLADGTGYAVGEARLYETTDGITWTKSTTIPELYTDQGFGGAYINAVACSDTRLTASGLWTAETTSDGAATWQKAATFSFDVPAFVTTVRHATSGTWMATGYYGYLGRSTDGVTFTAVTSEVPGALQWVNDVASDGATGWWAVGEKGAVLHSSDDGVTFTSVTVPTTEDLYAAAFVDANHGAVAGAHGAVFVTADGGASWTDASTGLDGYVGAALWLDAATLIVGGESGVVLRRAL